MSITTSRTISEFVIERQRILGEVDHALDRVLDRHETEIDLTGLDRIEHVWHGSIGNVLGSGEVGEGRQRLLGERAERTEEADTLRHGRSGYVSDPITWHDESVDEVTLRQLVDDVQIRARSAPTPRSIVCAACRSPTSTARRSTITDTSARACPRRSTDRANNRTTARGSWRSCLEHGTGPVLLTRSSADQRAACRAVDDGVSNWAAACSGASPSTVSPARVVVVTAGTSDRAVADEALATLRAAGVDADLVTDVGVAGLHRLLATTRR